MPLVQYSTTLLLQHLFVSEDPSQLIEKLYLVYHRS
jgi:hypothetical protein